MDAWVGSGGALGAVIRRAVGGISPQEGARVPEYLLAIAYIDGMHRHTMSLYTATTQAIQEQRIGHCRPCAWRSKHRTQHKQNYYTT